MGWKMKLLLSKKKNQIIIIIFHFSKKNNEYQEAKENGFKGNIEEYFSVRDYN